MTMQARITLIAAVARNGAIGRNNTLPWRLKADLVRFKTVTLGHPILMGRKTWDSLGRPLPGRRNLVVTRNATFTAAGAEIFPTPEAALQQLGENPVFVIGGADLYRQLLDRADTLLLTEVQTEVEGDAFFPAFDRTAFVEVSREPHPADADNQFAFDFVEYHRRR